MTQVIWLMLVFVLRPYLMCRVSQPMDVTVMMWRSRTILPPSPSPPGA